MTWRRVLGYGGGAILGAVLLVAAWAKAIDPAAFAEQIVAEGLGGAGTAGLVALVALALEIGLGAALVLGLRHRWVLLPAAALVAFFLFLTGRAYWRFAHGLVDEAAACGCFGNLVSRTPAEAFWQDLLLLVPPLALAFVARPTGPPGRWRPALVAGLSAAGLLFAVLAPGLPLDDLATRLAPGVRVAELCAGAPDSPERVCLDAIAGELETGRHRVVLADLEDEAFLAAVPGLNELAADAEVGLWVVTASPPEAVATFGWTQAPAFEVREAPRSLVRPLYRTLPRSFEVDAGVVVRTWTGVPEEA